MPVLDGVAAAREVCRAAPTVGILMLTMLDDEESVRAALRAGAAGYVVKGDSREQLAAGRSTTAIAAGLHLATKTVHNNLSTIFTKLGVADRTEAAVLARRAGLGD